MQKDDMWTAKRLPVAFPEYVFYTLVPLVSQFSMDHHVSHRPWKVSSLPALLDSQGAASHWPVFRCLVALSRLLGSFKKPAMCIIIPPYMVVLKDVKDHLQLK